jgi:hypothetical protein
MVYIGNMALSNFIMLGKLLQLVCRFMGCVFIFSDQYPGHPDAVNSMVAATDNVLITACEDGIIRAVHLFPHRFIGQVGAGASQNCILWSIFVSQHSPPTQRQHIEK